MTCTSGASLLTPYGWVLLLLLLHMLMLILLLGPCCNINSFLLLFLHLQRRLSRCTGRARAMTTPGLAAGPLPTLLPRNITLLVTKIINIVKRSQTNHRQHRYRRGASLVRVGPILLALGGRRRARSYNSVEVHNPCHSSRDQDCQDRQGGNTLMVMVAMMTEAIYQAQD